MAANSPGIANSFKAEVLQGIHNLGVGVTRASTAADTLKGALYTQNSSIGPTTTAYTPTGEVSGTNYTAGGATVTNAVVPTVSGGATAYWTPSATLTWSNVTLSTLFDTLLIYNSTQSNRAILTATFGAVTVTAGNFSITFPTNSATTGLIQLT
jgi:hypothetical protein